MLFSCMKIYARVLLFGLICSSYFRYKQLVYIHTCTISGPVLYPSLLHTVIGMYCMYVVLQGPKDQSYESKEWDFAIIDVSGTCDLHTCTYMLHM